MLADLPEGRAGHAVTAALGHLYVLGGGWQTPFTANARYDVANDVWGSVASPITGEWRTLGATTRRHQLRSVCLCFWRLAWRLSVGCAGVPGVLSSLFTLMEV